LQVSVTASSAGPNESAERRAAAVVCLSRLPAFHPAALKLLNISSESASAMEDFESAFRSDPALATDLLLVANSPLFGIRAEVTTIRHALMLLGLATVRALASNIAIGYFVRNHLRTGYIRDIWSHGIATALIAEKLGILAGWPDLYTAGLTHDLGRLGFLLVMGPRYETEITREYRDMSEANQMETDLFGMDHCQAGWVVGSKWGFPKFLCDSMTHHHDTQFGPPPWPGQPLALVRIACQLADSLGLPEVHWRQQPPPLELPKDLESHSAFAPDKLREEILQRIAVMGG
jgi:HD-like signal output (HDOD) protein